MMTALRCVHAKNGPDEIYVEPSTGRLKCRTCKRQLNRKYKRAKAAKKKEEAALLVNRLELDKVPLVIKL